MEVRSITGTSLEVVDVIGWSSVASKMAGKWPKFSVVHNRAWAVLGHFGASYGGCGGCQWWWRYWGSWEEQVVAMDEWEMAENRCGSSRKIT